MALRAKKRGKGRISRATASSEDHARVMKKNKAGTGKRFASMTKQLAKKSARSPKALSAWIGRKKYGTKKMTKMAVAGKRRYGHPRTEAERKVRHARLHPGSPLPPRGTGRKRKTE